VISEHADPPGTPRSLEPGRPEEVVRLDRVRYRPETLRMPIAEVSESTGYFIFYAGRAGASRRGAAARLGSALQPVTRRRVGG
jgi:hypothetical protein